MKHILRVLALCLLLALPACALADSRTYCYWQLEAVERCLWPCVRSDERPGA